MTHKKLDKSRVLFAGLVAGAVGAASLWAGQRTEEVEVVASAEQGAYSSSDLKPAARDVVPDPERYAVAQMVLAVFPNEYLSDATILHNRREGAERAQVATAACYLENFDLSEGGASDWAQFEVDLTFSSMEGESLLRAPSIEGSQLTPLRPRDPEALTADPAEKPGAAAEELVTEAPERLEADEMADFAPLPEKVSGADPTREELQQTVSEPESPRQAVDGEKPDVDFENPCNTVPQVLAGELAFGQQAVDLQTRGADVLSEDEVTRLTDVFSKYCGQDGDDGCYTTELVGEMYPIHAAAIERLAKEGFVDLG